MSIIDRMRDPKNLRLNAAQRSAYSQAKRWHFFRLCGALLLEGLAPFVILAIPGVRPFVELIGGVWALISHLVFQRIESTQTAEAATIQEEFDTVVLSLPWNPFLAGRKIDPEVIHTTDTAYRGNRDDFLTWYGDTASVPYPLDVLICQRSNLVWDSQLRRRYARGLAVIVGAIFVVGAVVGLLARESFAEYLLGLCLPSLPAVLEGVDIYRSHSEYATKKDDLKEQVMLLWDGALTKGQPVTQEQCRELQDAIFVSRSTGPLVLDRLYQHFRRADDMAMHDTVARMVEEYHCSAGPPIP